MGLEYSFSCPLPNGIHARPASGLESVTRRFSCTISITNMRTSASANAKSVLGMVGLAIQLNDRCMIQCNGPDEADALAAVIRFVEHELPHGDDDVLPVEAPVSESPLPPMLGLANPTVLRGRCMVPGIGQGRAVRIDVIAIPDALVHEPINDVGAEVARLESGLSAMHRHYDDQVSARGDRVAASVLGAHRATARDPALREFLLATVRRDACSAAAAIAAAEAHFSAMLAASESLLLRERVLDIRDVCGTLFHLIYGSQGHGRRTTLVVNSVCVADNMTPGELLSLDRRFLKGLVLGHSASTSHTIILARAFGIPTLTGVPDLHHKTLEGCSVVVDSDLGILVTTDNEAVRRYYDLEEARLADRRARLVLGAAAPAATSDGHRLEIGANIATAEEAGPAFASGADGIGLFRTEMLFVNREDPPSEAEQFDEYRGALEAASGKPVIIRTLDVGGDKPIPYLQLPHEENPFLGLRAVRMYPRFEALIRTQLRALVRASAFGELRVMVPMVSRLDEVAWVKQIIADEQSTCAADGVAFDPAMQVGAMVEVPAMVFQLDHFCRVLDFFSVGTNDLLQYFLAVDRTNDRVTALYDPMTPGFLGLLTKLVRDAHAAGRWVGLCGELGGQLQALPLLIGIGFDEISIAAPGVAGAKADLHALNAAACGALLDRALACASGDDVRQLLASDGGRDTVPLLSTDVILLDVECGTREEAIKRLVDQLYIAGRTEHPRDLEAAVWKREEVYSTAFGHGFAIPHCRSNAVLANSLAIMRLRRPVAWESLDGEPVSVLVLLAIRESDEAAAHLKILATLARRVMHEEFRERLAVEQDPGALSQFVLDSIGG